MADRYLPSTSIFGPWLISRGQAAPTRGRLSFVELEVPDVGVTPTRGQVSFVELEVPIVPTRGEVSFAELEVPNKSARGQLSFSELEVPELGLKGQVSFLALEVPGESARGQVSFLSLDIIAPEDYIPPEPPIEDMNSKNKWLRKNATFLGIPWWRYRGRRYKK